MNRDDQDGLHPLLSAVADATIREDQVVALTKMLASDADVRRFYVRYLDMHAALAFTASRSVPVPERRWRPSWSVIGASLTAASLVLAWFLLLGGPHGGTPERLASERTPSWEQLPSYVATIGSTTNDATLDGEAVSAGKRLTAGSYALTAGSVAVQFDGGARVLLAGQSRFTILSRTAMAIDRGTFTFRGDQTCESIEIITPHSVFRNIGTRYAAVIDADAEEIHVAEGVVRRTTGSGSQPPRHELIAAGVGRRYHAEEVAGATDIPLDVRLVERSAEGDALQAVAVQPLVVDDFQSAGDRIDGMQSGSGWADPWRSRQGELRLVSPGLTGEGSRAVLHDGSSDDADQRRSAAHRQLDTPIDLSQDGVWYVRFFVRRGASARKDEHRAMVVLRKRGLAPQDEIDQGALIQIALRREDVAMVRVANTLTRVSLPQVQGHTYAVVAKIVSGRVKPEQVLVRVLAADRLANSKEPAEWSVVSHAVSTDLCLDQLSLECVSRGQIEFGDVAVGPTWQSITTTSAALQ